MSISGLTLASPDIDFKRSRNTSKLHDEMYGCRTLPFVEKPQSLGCTVVPSINLKEADSYQHFGGLGQEEISMAVNAHDPGLYHVFIGSSFYDQALKDLVHEARKLTKGHHQFRDVNFHPQSNKSDNPDDPDIFETIAYDAQVIAKAFNIVFKKSKGPSKKSAEQLFNFLKANQIFEYNSRGKVVVTKEASRGKAAPKTIMFHEVRKDVGTLGTSQFAYTVHHMTRGEDIRFSGNILRAYDTHIRGVSRQLITQYIQQRNLPGDICSDTSDESCLQTVGDLALLIASSLYAGSGRSTNTDILAENISADRIALDPRFHWSPAGLTYDQDEIQTCRAGLNIYIIRELYFWGTVWNLANRDNFPNLDPKAEDLERTLTAGLVKFQALDAIWKSLDNSGYEAHRVQKSILKLFTAQKPLVKAKFSEHENVYEIPAEDLFPNAANDNSGKPIHRAFYGAAAVYCFDEALTTNKDFIPLVNAGFEFLRHVLIPHISDVDIGYINGKSADKETNKDGLSQRYNARLKDIQEKYEKRKRRVEDGRTKFNLSKNTREFNRRKYRQ